MIEAEPLEIPSPRGPVRALYHAPAQNGAAVVCVGGFDGGFDGPADRLFPALAEDLAPRAIGVLRVDFRDSSPTGPGVVSAGASDVNAAVAELRRRGVKWIALAGHSFGGAVMITVAAADPAIAAVVTLSTQTAGAQGAPLIAPRPLLLIHGLDDIRLPPDCSRYVYAIAGEPKKLVLLEGARHSLRQSAPEVRRLVREWLIENLTSGK